MTMISVGSIFMKINFKNQSEWNGSEMGDQFSMYY